MYCDIKWQNVFAESEMKAEILHIEDIMCTCLQDSTAYVVLSTFWDLSHMSYFFIVARACVLGNNVSFLKNIL